ncbi:hypothetical protein Nepgr_019436 [Nepenthes gracilis]|uniref:Uncharacterized protein n=1 Tax=Nepenthes gracilis TaxID=150966 RepID=A0AAD3XV86_NEPGR|nr:hypothetical protein Nepgr_019436 [Nepenthes gracilis]
MASKTLLRSGGSLFPRIMDQALTQIASNSNAETLVSRTVDITKKLLSSASGALSTQNLPRKDSVVAKNLSFESYFYPCAISPVRFFLPDGKGKGLDEKSFEILTRVNAEGLWNPCGQPSLEFFLPDGNDSSEPMILFPKRTYQPSTIRRKRTHGFFARKATKDSQLTLVMLLSMLVLATVLKVAGASDLVALLVFIVVPL